MAVERELPTDEARDLLSLTRDIAAAELAPVAADYERDAIFPRKQLQVLGAAGMLGLPYDTAYGGGGAPFAVYLQVLEELATAWLSVALGVSVHTLTCNPLATFGSDGQKDQWLPDMLGGELLGAYCLSEPASGSDAASLATSASRDGDDYAYVVNGTKAWITHAGEADYYTLLARTSDDGSRGISCFLAPADLAGISVASPERKMGMRSSPTAQVMWDNVRIPADRLIGTEGQGFAIAMHALDAGRLGISACAVGVAQAALDCALGYARQRQQFGRSIATFQGIQFLLADMATQIEAGRALYLHAAALKDAGKKYSTQAAMAKLFTTDAAMWITTQAVQILGAAGYSEDYPVERYMREAKVLQIVEGTNQIQRVVIGRSLTD